MEKEYLFNDEQLRLALIDWRAALIGKGATPELADTCRMAVERFMNSRAAYPLVNVDAQVNLG